MGQLLSRSSVGLCTLLLATSAAAQSSIPTFVEIAFGSALLAEGEADSVAGLGDVDGDGLGDFALGFSKADTAQGLDSGRVLVLSGGDRSVLWSAEGSGAGDRFGFAMAAAGDVDDDGKHDLIVGAPFGAAPTFGYARVLSGDDGSLLLDLDAPGDTLGMHFGEQLAGNADFDADGYADLLVLQHGNGFGPVVPATVRAYSGATGEVLHTFSEHGIIFDDDAIGTVGDVNGDGHDEILYGSATKSSFFVHVRSGADGEPLQTFDGFSAEGVGDIDGDGVDDLLFGNGDLYSGATWTPLLDLPASGSPRGLGDLDGDGIGDVALGREVFSGADGHSLFAAVQTQDFVPVGDVDGDGRPDLLGTPGHTVDSEAVSPARLFRNATALRSVLEGEPGQALGSSVANAGDVDADGHADLIVGLPLDDTYGEDAGTVRVLSGATGAIVFELAGQAASDEFGTTVASAGDVDGDGTPDILVGTPFEDVDGAPRGSARVYSGDDGQLLFARFGTNSLGRFGYAVAAAGDVNDDGLADIVVGAPFSPTTAQKRGRVVVYAGPSGDVLFEVVGASNLLELGRAVAGAGDVNGDGLDDILAGAPATTLTTGGKVGSARLLSGAGGAQLGSFSGVGPERGLGSTVAALGDLDDDGAPDFALGGRWLNPSFPTDWDRAVVFSGATGARLFTWTLQPPGPNEGGPALGAAGDVDGDGTPDIALGVRISNFTGFAEVRSGSDGTTLLSQGGRLGDSLGGSVAGGGDCNGDGRADVLIGVPGDDAGGSGAGAVRVLGLSPVAPPWTFLGKALLGAEGLPLLVGTGSLVPGEGVLLSLTGARPGARTALVVGFDAVSLPFKGGTLVPSPDLIVYPILTTTQGAWALPAHWPAGVPSGRELFFQTLVLDPAAVAGFSMSNALRAQMP